MITINQCVAWRGKKQNKAGGRYARKEPAALRGASAVRVGETIQDGGIDCCIRNDHGGVYY